MHNIAGLARRSDFGNAKGLEGSSVAHNFLRLPREQGLGGGHNSALASRERLKAISRSLRKRKRHNTRRRRPRHMCFPKSVNAA